MADITIAEIRQKYPQYSDLSDRALADALHAKYYGDLPADQFYKKIGLTDGMAKPPEAAPPSAIDQSFDQFTGGVKPALDMNGQEDTLREIPNTLTDKIFNSAGNVADQMLLSGGDEALAGLYGIGAMVPGGRSPGEAFQEELARLQQKRGDFASVEPVLSQATNATGMVLSPANVVGGEYIQGAKTLPGTMVRSSKVGASVGGTSGFLGTDGPVEKRLEGGGYGAGIGTVAGAALPVATSFVAPKVAPEVKALIDRGIIPTPGQMAGGMLKRTEEKMTSIPILGDMITSAQRRGIEQFNRATYEAVLEPLKVPLTGTQAVRGRAGLPTVAQTQAIKTPDKIGREGIEQLNDILSDEYNKLLPQMQFVPDQQFVADVTKISQNAAFMPKQQADQFQKILTDKIGTRLGTTGIMDGETLKGLESELGTLAKGYSKDPSFDNRQLGSAISELQDTIRQTLTRSNPAQAAQLQKINAAYARFKRVQMAAANTGTDQGIFMPGQFQQAVKSKDASVDKGKFAKGQALMQDISDPGKHVLGDKYPDSGTAGRLIVNLLMGGAGATGLGIASPQALGLLAALAAPYTKLGGKALTAALTKRPGFAAPLRGLLERISPVQGQISGQTGAGMVDPRLVVQP